MARCTRPDVLLSTLIASRSWGGFSHLEMMHYDDWLQLNGEARWLMHEQTLLGLCRPSLGRFEGRPVVLREGCQP